MAYERIKERKTKEERGILSVFRVIDNEVLRFFCKEQMLCVQLICSSKKANSNRGTEAIFAL